MAKTLTLREIIVQDSEIAHAWGRLSPNTQRRLLDMDERKRVPYLLNDSTFKKIFDPDTNGEVLSRFISSVLGRKVKVLHSLKNEGHLHSERSKKIILDIVAQFEDGSIVNVEIQRLGINFPPQRAACYSADLITRQFAAEKGEPKREIDYTDIKPVYTIIILEESRNLFSSEDYIHHFSQKSDTGAELELLQYYVYICLDKFCGKHPRITAELEKWLDFLTITDMDKMTVFLAENPSFQPLYDCAILMLRDKKELLNMISDFWENEDVMGSYRLTTESIIKQLKEDNEKIIAEKDAVIANREAVIASKDALIEELRQQLASGGNRR